MAGSRRLRGRARARAEREEALAAERRAEIQGLLDAQAHTQLALLDALRELRGDVVTHDAEVVRVLELAINVCDHVIECVEADRNERREIVDALAAIARSLSAPPAPIAIPTNGHARIIGGRVLGGDDNLMHEPVPMIDLTDAHDTSVEVRCRYEGRWVDGFEVCETIHTDTGERYRLRRRLDGTILPELFAAADIRHVETFEELEPASESTSRRIWSRL
jgi:hypothetical protein